MTIRQVITQGNRKMIDFPIAGAGRQIHAAIAALDIFQTYRVGIQQPPRAWPNLPRQADIKLAIERSLQSQNVDQGIRCRLKRRTLLRRMAMISGGT